MSMVQSSFLITSNPYLGRIPGRKLFHVGDFNLMECYRGYVDSIVLDEYLCGTDLGTLWL